MEYPQYAKVNDKLYKINTDFRYALKCNKIAEDNSISDFERALGIIYTLFGEEGINDTENYETLLKKAILYLKCGDDTPIDDEKVKPDMNFEQDEKYIRSSFKYDYDYDPYKEKYLHWYEFYNDLCNLSDSEFGSCCILNRIRQLRNYDVRQIKDEKERNKILKAKKKVSLKQEVKKPTEKQHESSRKFFEELYKK